MKKRFNDEQIAGVLAEYRAGATVADLARKFGVSTWTINNWQKKFGEMQASEVRKLKGLEAKIQKLERIVAGQAVELLAAKDLLQVSKKLVSLKGKKKALLHIRAKFKISIRRACSLLRLQRSTACYKSKRARSDESLKESIMKIVNEKSYVGLPRVLEALRLKGFADNHKRVARIYREMNLQLGKRPKKRRRVQRVRLALAVPSAPNELWAMDFVLDTLSSGRRFRCFNVKDLFTHEVVAIHVARSITGEDVARVLDVAATKYGQPQGIVCDNGTEFTSIAMDRRQYKTKTELKFIQPGKPIQNAFIESFNAIFRNECLNLHWFENLDVAKEIIESYRKEYNFRRTQKRLLGKTPNQFANDYKDRLCA